tara:strand:+ start:314 stop:490 length:177 start_codon:yes stop_codon:yes gene_type:complete
MTRKEELVSNIVNSLAELKNTIDPDDEMSLGEYDILHGDIEEVQHLFYDIGLRMNINL